MESIGENLRKVRVLKNFSQEYVADHIGVSVSSYARYESGKVAIDFDSVVKLAGLYKLSIDELYNFSNADFNAHEPREEYIKSAKVTILVELDGQQPTLDNWMVKLSKINAAI